MKLKSINKNFIKKGFYLTGLSLMCLSTSGCSKQDTNINIKFIIEESNKDINGNDEKQAIAEATDTQILLQTFNSRLKETKLTVDDLEYLSQFNGDMFSIKTEFDTYMQASYSNYNIVNNGENLELVLSGDVGGIKYDLLIGKIAESNKEDYYSINVGEYINKNNIKIRAYTFPTCVAYGDEAKEKIKQIYGEDVFSLIQEYGIPIKMYESKDFYNVYQKTKIK